jgi:transcriptional regulator with XRE-family HTH domain
MTTSPTTSLLPEYVADYLGAPFEVVLSKSVKQTIDADGNVLKTTIPNPRGLLRQVAITRLIHPRKLSGKDIKFVRKALSIKAKELAEIIAVSPEHFSRCETDKAVLSPGIEKFLRLSILVDTLKLPAEIEQQLEVDALMKLSKFRKAFERLQDSIRSMQIEAVYDSHEPLRLQFHVIDHSPSNDDGELDYDEDWYDELDIAA